MQLSPPSDPGGGEGEPRGSLTRSSNLAPCFRVFQVSVDDTLGFGGGFRQRAQGRPIMDLALKLWLALVLECSEALWDS